MISINFGMVNYIIKHMMNDENFKLEHNANMIHIFSLCDSKLEVIYLLSALRTIEKNFMNTIGIGPNYDYRNVTYIKDTYPAIIIYDAWNGYGGCGPSAMAIVPQVQIGNYRADFVIFVSDDNAGSTWDIDSIIEIDGYGVHKKTRAKDEEKEQYLKTQAPSFFHFYEETTDINTWFDEVIKEEERKIMEDIERMT